jgi:Flp pilus assembly pilin Flp
MSEGRPTSGGHHQSKQVARSTERGASLVEYGLLVALIAAITVVAVDSVGLSVAWTIYDANVALSGDSPDGPVGQPAPPSRGRPGRGGGRTDGS